MNLANVQRCDRDQNSSQDQQNEFLRTMNLANENQGNRQESSTIQDQKNEVLSGFNAQKNEKQRRNSAQDIRNDFFCALNLVNAWQDKGKG